MVSQMQRKHVVSLDDDRDDVGADGIMTFAEVVNSLIILCFLSALLVVSHSSFLKYHCNAARTTLY